MRRRLLQKIRQFSKEKKRRNKLIGLLLILSIFVSSGVFWALHLQGIAMTIESTDPSEANPSEGIEDPLPEQQPSEETSNDLITEETGTEEVRTQETSILESQEPSSAETNASEAIESTLATEVEAETAETEIDSSGPHTEESKAEETSVVEESSAELAEEAKPSEISETEENETTESSQEPTSPLKSFSTFAVINGKYELMQEFYPSLDDALILENKRFVNIRAFAESLQDLDFNPAEFDPRTLARVSEEKLSELLQGRTGITLEPMPVLEYKGEIWLEMVEEETIYSLIYLPRGLKTEDNLTHALAPLDPQYEQMLRQPGLEARYLQAPLSEEELLVNAYTDALDPRFLAAQNFLFLTFQDETSLAGELPENLFVLGSTVDDPRDYTVELNRPETLFWKVVAADGNEYTSLKKSERDKESSEEVQLEDKLEEPNELPADTSAETNSSELISFKEHNATVVLKIEEIQQNYRITAIEDKTKQALKINEVPIFAVIDGAYEEISRLEITEDSTYQKDNESYIKIDLLQTALEPLGFNLSELNPETLACAPLETAEALLRGEIGHQLKPLPLMEDEGALWLRITDDENRYAIYYLPRGLEGVSPFVEKSMKMQMMGFASEQVSVNEESAEIEEYLNSPDAVNPEFLAAQNFVKITFTKEEDLPLELPEDQYVLASAEEDPQDFEMELPISEEYAWQAVAADGTVTNSPGMEEAEIDAGLAKDGDTFDPSLENAEELSGEVLEKESVSAEEQNTEAEETSDFPEESVPGADTANDAVHDEGSKVSFTQLENSLALRITAVEQSYQLRAVEVPAPTGGGWLPGSNNDVVTWYAIVDGKRTEIVKTKGPNYKMRAQAEEWLYTPLDVIKQAYIERNIEFGLRNTSKHNDLCASFLRVNSENGLDEPPISDGSAKFTNVPVLAIDGNNSKEVGGYAYIRSSRIRPTDGHVYSGTHILYFPGLKAVQFKPENELATSAAYNYGRFWTVTVDNGNTNLEIPSIPYAFQGNIKETTKFTYDRFKDPIPGAENYLWGAFAKNPDGTIDITRAPIPVDYDKNTGHFSFDLISKYIDRPHVIQPLQITYNIMKGDIAEERPKVWSNVNAGNLRAANQSPYGESLGSSIESWPTIGHGDGNSNPHQFTESIKLLSDGTYEVLQPNQMTRISQAPDAMGYTLQTYSFEGWQVTLKDGSQTTWKVGDKVGLAVLQNANLNIPLEAKWTLDSKKTNKGHKIPITNSVGFYVHIAPDNFLGKQYYTDTIYTSKVESITQDTSDKISRIIPNGNYFSLPVIGKDPNLNDSQDIANTVGNIEVNNKIRMLKEDNSNNPLKVIDFPPDEFVFARMRSWVERYKEVHPDGEIPTVHVLSADGSTVKVDRLEDITSDNYSINWYVLKLENDGWHIDGEFVEKPGNLRVMKTFSGDIPTVGSVNTPNKLNTESFAIHMKATGGTNLRYTDKTLTIGMSGDSDVLKQGWIDEEQTTYYWDLSLKNGAKYEMSETGFETVKHPKDEILAQFRIINSKDASNWQEVTADVVPRTVTVESYDSNVPHDAWQTFIFNNRYGNDFTLRKVDKITDLPMDAIFNLYSEEDGSNPVKFTNEEDSNVYTFETGVLSNNVTDITTVNGELVFKNLPEGRYKLVEKPLDGYVNHADVEFSIKSDEEGKQTYTLISPSADDEFTKLDNEKKILTILNEPLKLTVKVNKIWDPEDKAENVTMQLYANDVEVKQNANNEKITTSFNISSDSTNSRYWNNHTEIITNLPLYKDGEPIDYSIKERWIGPDAYSPEVDQDGFANYDVTIEKEYLDSDENSLTDLVTEGSDGTKIYAETMIFTVTNKPQGYPLVFTKSDAADINIKLGGAIFALYDEKDYNASTGQINDGSRAIETATSEAETGIVHFENIQVGNYYMKEIKSPVGYKPNDSIYKVEVRAYGNAITDTADQAVPHTKLTDIPNQRTNLVILNKVDDSNPGKPQADVEFEIFKSVSTEDFKDNFIPYISDKTGGYKYVTDSEGFAFIDNLDKGVYRITETIPRPGFIAVKPFYIIVEDVNGNLEIKPAQNVDGKWEADDKFANEKIIKEAAEDKLTLSIRVINKSGGAELPATGGSGIGYHVMLGISLMTASTLTAWLRRKRGKGGVG